jgi:hypothetical protein
MLQSSAAASSVEDCDESDDAKGQDEQRKMPQDARLWGFIRHGKAPRGEDPKLTESDISLWFDQECCRFFILADKVVKDDLAPIEFVQFVRELRHSTTQILFKFETRLDGSVGRPYCVWS